MICLFCNGDFTRAEMKDAVWITKNQPVHDDCFLEEQDRIARSALAKKIPLP